MNVGQSVKAALKINGKNQSWLSRELNLTTQRVSAIANSSESNTATITKLANVFNMSDSEFVALGEHEKT